MVRRDVDALVKWAVGSGAAAVLPHTAGLPPVLATSLTWVGALGILITAVIAVVVGLTRLATEAARLIDALDSLRTRIRQFRRHSKARNTRKGGTRKAPPSPAR
jgi:hypothetical protein